MALSIHDINNERLLTIKPAHISKSVSFISPTLVEIIHKYVKNIMLMLKMLALKQSKTKKTMHST